ncbi:MAG: hypothetical protein KAR44_05075 [Candidatus Aegiribacteria sp.]|nr:hypothetical protein [Candidatus Aegiribacteria sp.]
MKFLVSFGTLLLVLPVTALAFQTETYGWEESFTVLSVYGNGNPDLEYTTPVYSGTQSLEFYESPLGGTPQAIICWIQNLDEGDTVAASFYVFDDTPSASPSGRIWGHYNANYSDPTHYDGSAGGNSTYSSGIGWEQLSWEWTIDADSTHGGLMIEGRIYSSSEFDTIWFDQMEVIVPDGATIVWPNVTVALQRSTWADIKASF